MRTLLLPTDSAEALAAAVARAADHLRAGEPVALPTETVYGLAADALRPEAVARVFEAKERPFFDPLIVHLPEAGWFEAVCAPFGSAAADELVARLRERFWPGPLTLVLPRRPETIPDLVTAGGPLVAVRRSAHPVFGAVAAAFGRPLAAPSANRFGRLSPTTGAHVLAELGGKIPLVLDAGPCPHGIESTIVAVVPAPGGSGARPALRVLRPGPVPAEALAELAPVLPAPLPGNGSPEPAGASAPGQLPSHYAPRAALVLLEGAVGGAAAVGGLAAGRRTGLLAWRADRPPPEPDAAAGRWVRTEYLSAAGDLREAAANLFAALRRLDDAGVELILAEPVPATGLGVAILERLRRAAAPRPASF